MSVLPQTEIAMHLFSYFARVARQGRDRRGDVTTVHHATGLPESANDLLPKHRAVTGKRLALETVVVPERLAASILRRPVADKHEPPVALVSISPEDWNADERAWVNDLTFQIKVVVHQGAERGWFLERPDSPWEGEPLPLGEDGLCVAFKITWAGLREAMPRTEGTRWERGPVSLEHDLGKDLWRSAPQWAQDQARNEVV